MPRRSSPKRPPGPVAADEADVVAERQQLFLDRGDQRGVVAARQVGAADRAAKQHVADMGEFGGAVVVDDMAGRMAGAMQHLERHARRSDTVSPSSRKRSGTQLRTRVGQAEALRLVLEIGEQRPVGLVRADDLDAERVLQVHRAAGMIDMAVGDPDRRDGDAVVVERRQNASTSPPGSTTTPCLVVRVEQDRAVLLERRDRHDAGVELSHDRPSLCSPPFREHTRRRPPHPAVATRKMKRAAEGRRA